MIGMPTFGAHRNVKMMCVDEVEAFDDVLLVRDVHNQVLLPTWLSASILCNYGATFGLPLA